MAAGTFTLFGKNKDRLSELDLSTATIKLALVSSAYTPNVTNTGHSLWSEVSANEIANGQGYTTGGVALTSLALIAASTTGFALDSADPVWTASGTGIPAHRYYVMRVVGTLWGRVDPLIGYFVGDSTPADIPLTTSGNTLTVTVPAAGWFDAT